MIDLDETKRRGKKDKARQRQAPVKTRRFKADPDCNKLGACVPARSTSNINAALSSVGGEEADSVLTSLQICGYLFASVPK